MIVSIQADRPFGAALRNKGIDHAEKYRIEGGSTFQSRSIPQVDFAVPQVDFAIFQVDLANGIEEPSAISLQFHGSTGENRTSACAAANSGDSQREPVAAAASIDRSRTKKEPERIVIFRLGSLGDTIVSLPCLPVRWPEVFPNAERIVLTNVPVSAKAAPLDMILANSALIDGVIDYPIGLRSAQRLWALRRRLRDVRARTMIYLAPVRGRLEVYRDIVFFWLCGITQIIGAPTSKDLCEHRIDPVSGDLEPECSRLARTLAPLGRIELEDPANWDLRLTDRERAVGAKTVAASKEGLTSPSIWVAKRSKISGATIIGAVFSGSFRERMAAMGSSSSARPMTPPASPA